MLDLSSAGLMVVTFLLHSIDFILQHVVTVGNLTNVVKEENAFQLRGWSFITSMQDTLWVQQLSMS